MSCGCRKHSPFLQPLIPSEANGHSDGTNINDNDGSEGTATVASSTTPSWYDDPADIIRLDWTPQKGRPTKSKGASEDSYKDEQDRLKTKYFGALVSHDVTKKSKSIRNHWSLPSGLLKLANDKGSKASWETSAGRPVQAIGKMEVDGVAYKSGKTHKTFVYCLVSQQAVAAHPTEFQEYSY